jgi:hypothetical protein
MLLCGAQSMHRAAKVIVLGAKGHSFGGHKSENRAAMRLARVSAMDIASSSARL